TRFSRDWSSDVCSSDLGQIVQTFMAEGMVYNLLAAALGILLGIAITFTMTQFIGRLFNDVTGQINAQAGGIFAVSFNLSWQSVEIGRASGRETAQMQVP